MNGSTPIARHLRIHGVVQGVGFRQGLRSEAKSLGVAGWVRNRLDGTVEALVHGDRARVEALVHWAHHGPRGARVSRVEVSRVGVSKVDIAEGIESTIEAGTDGDFLCHPTG